MKSAKHPPVITYGRILKARELGSIIRAFRKSHHLTLEKVSGITNLSMRFLSELERGKKTAELGKTLTTINQLGLELIILLVVQVNKLRRQQLNSKIKKNTMKKMIY